MKKIKNTKDNKDIADFLETMLNSKEKQALTKRLLIATLLTEGETYRKIEEIVWVSPSTVRNIKKLLESSGQKIKLVNTLN